MKEVAVAVFDVLWPEFMPKPSVEMWEKIARDFEQYWQLPTVIVTAPWMASMWK